MGCARPSMRDSKVGSVSSSRAKYTLLSRRENVSLKGRQALKTLLAANKRLNTAYVLKKSFGQRWGYEREGWARRFFDNWRASLKWQRLKPYEEFAEMIDRHWDGIAAYCKPENKVRSISLKDLTTRSESSNDAHTDSETRSTCDCKS
ncbi:hypothetical protein BH20PSE1_BH20PSE1_22850 [soil metagenome]